MTCDDDGGRKAAGNSYNMGTVLDTLGENRYRLPSPSIKGRYQICMQLFEKHGIELTAEARDELSLLVASMQSTKGTLFHAIASKLNRLVKANANTTEKDIASIHDIKMAFVTGDRDSSISISAPKAKNSDQSKSDLFSSIGGNNEAKRALVDALAFDERKKRILLRFGLSPPSGVLLYGPPGCGKTLLAKATALMMQPVAEGGDSVQGLGRAGGLFISLSASDIVRSEVGSSEKLVASAFETARKNAPAVIFIDEFQALFTSRDGAGGAGKSSSRLASTLLQCMDDIAKWRDADSSVAKQVIDEDSERNRVVVLGATNTPWMVDRAFLRAGRFDRVSIQFHYQQDRCYPLSHCCIL